MPSFPHDDLDFHYIDHGQGIPLVVQHGLGSDLTSPSVLFDPPEGFRLISMDARGHGETRPLGPEEKLRIAQLADDVLALLDHLGIEKAIVGGISMGAAIGLNLALRYPNRLLGLILSRPAWLDRPYPENLRIFSMLTELIQQHGPQEGRRRFLESKEYQALKLESPESAETLADQFLHPRATETAAKFDRIARDAPCVGQAGWDRISVPTLVLANDQDPIHPRSYAETFALTIPGAEQEYVTPKSESLIGHGQDVRAALHRFLGRYFSMAARERA